MAAMMLVARRGPRLGRWVTNTGDFVTIGMLILTPWVNLWRGHLAHFHPLRLVLPPRTLFSLCALAFGYASQPSPVS
jgi:hypothetical protein